MNMKENGGKNIHTDDHRLASYLSSLLHKVLYYHDVDGLSQIVLHELSHDHSFALEKATYLIDNPDFNHLLGVAGYNHDECHFHEKDLWKNPYSFTKDMQEAKYHNDIKAYLNDSLKRKDVNLANSKEIVELGINLGIKNPQYFTWNMKHGNHGLLIFEQKNVESNSWRRELLHNIAAILSFCGI